MISTDNPMSLTNLQYTVKNRYLLLQQIYRFVNTPMFEVAYSQATEEEKRILEGWIDTLEKDTLIKWVKNKNKDCLETYSTGELRELASRMGIKNYTNLTKDTLLSKIHQLKVKGT